MKRIALLGVLLALFVSGCVQKQPEDNRNLPCAVESYQPLVVKIESTPFNGGVQHGFGFVIGEEKGFLYIATPRHVIFGGNASNSLNNTVSASKPSIQISFRNQPGQNIAELVADAADGIDASKKRLDLVILRVKKNITSGVNNISWNAQSCYTWCSKWKENQQIWFIGNPNSNEDTWGVQPFATRRAAILSSSDSQNEFIKIDTNNTARPGTSGAPVISRGGITGMIVIDSPDNTIALPLVSIHDFVIKNSLAWNLRENTRCPLSDGNLVKIVYDESTDEMAQNTKIFLEKNNFRVELTEFSVWRTNVINNLPDKYDQPKIAGNNLFFYSTGETEPLADKIQNIVSQMPKSYQLTKQPLNKEHIAKGMGIGTGELLIVLNESPSWFYSLFNRSSD